MGTEKVPGGTQHFRAVGPPHIPTSYDLKVIIFSKFHLSMKRIPMTSVGIMLAVSSNRDAEIITIELEPIIYCLTLKMYKLMMIVT